MNRVRSERNSAPQENNARPEGKSGDIGKQEADFGPMVNLLPNSFGLLSSGNTCLEFRFSRKYM